MFNTLKRSYTIWKIIALNALQEAFLNRWTNALFFLGKALRFGMTLMVLFLIKQTAPTFAQYTTDQIIIFFLTYQFIDTLAQVLYRGVYLFSNQVRTGEFDFLLVKPVNPLFRALTGKPDINDVIFLLPTIVISVYIATQLDVAITLTSFLWYLVLLVNSFLIVTALHICILSIGILTTEIDGVMWLYRDLARLGQFPVGIYLEPLRFLLFFLVPIGMMITIPAEVLLSAPQSYSIAWAIAVGVSFFIFSLWFWNWSLKQYSSASS